MRVMFVSQCTKRALLETRRIIDQFAERKGKRVWETSITEQGLETVKNLLRATARRNTAVICHHFRRGLQQTEVLWVVGNRRRFNGDGTVPTHTTVKDVLRADDEKDWNTGEAMAIVVQLAGLFHDFGKANWGFQSKLKGEKSREKDPWRHEWLSLMLFRQFVGKDTDQKWLERLEQVSEKDEPIVLGEFEKLKTDPEASWKFCEPNQLKGLPKLAQFIGWLILSHHRLPKPYKRLPKPYKDEPELNRIDSWMEGDRFSARWNSPPPDAKNEQIKRLERFLDFSRYKTPLNSETWCAAAKKAAQRALSHPKLWEQNWFHDRFSMHLMRAVLMLADHTYSADGDGKGKGSAPGIHQDPAYKAYANTEKNGDKGKPSLKQKLDAHNIGVARMASSIMRSLPGWQESLPSLWMHKSFKQRSCDPKFAWQDRAYDLASTLKKRSGESGFFGVNLASTGCGKTLANARLMYALADEKEGCRFSIALGLRILTLQTGEALRGRLKLDRDDLAVLIGSSHFQRLYEENSEEMQEKEKEGVLRGSWGSESEEDPVDGEEEVEYEGNLDLGPIGGRLRSSPKLHKLISAPLLVCTIDHLIGATEGWRGGRQIAPILRLLTSDLVLDEPDDFGVEDLHALCRLVNFAGVFGSKVLISSATLPPAVIEALFSAYIAGRRAFNHARRPPGGNNLIPCAWFDEFSAVYGEHDGSDSYAQAHRAFVADRIEQLDKEVVLRRASLAEVKPPSCDEDVVVSAVAETLSFQMRELHGKHHQVCPSSSKQVSIGLVRFAHIDKLVAVVRKWFGSSPPPDYCLHICVYHARFTMLMRSKIERTLDRLLLRHSPDVFLQQQEVASALARDPARQHIFIVAATSVAEVGRDHDYDWALVEPSSMRSIIQLAGRVQRHRRIPPNEPNVVILNKNISALLEKKNPYPYSKPGFEGKKYCLESKDLMKALSPGQFKELTAKPRLCCPSEGATAKPITNFVDLEHARLAAELLGRDDHKWHAALWWKKSPDWCAALQRETPFRKTGCVTKTYIDYLQEEGEEPKLNRESKDRLEPVDSIYRNAIQAA